MNKFQFYAVYLCQERLVEDRATCFLDTTVLFNKQSPQQESQNRSWCLHPLLQIPVPKGRLPGEPLGQLGIRLCQGFPGDLFLMLWDKAALGRNLQGRSLDEAVPEPVSHHRIPIPAFHILQSPCSLPGFGQPTHPSPKEPRWNLLWI